MLDERFLSELSAKLKIDKERLAREFWEILILNEISKEKWSENLIFKGGTALRLAYGSPRFSDDLDFSVVGKLKTKDFFRFAHDVSSEFGIEITDAWEKRETIICEFRIKETVLAQSFRLKIEVSKRKVKPEYELRILKSDVSVLQVLMKTATLDFILEEKLSALRDRNEPRDIFDVWYICKLKNLEFREVISGRIFNKPDKSKIKQVLRKYLPVNWYVAVDEITKILGKI